MGIGLRTFLLLIIFSPVFACAEGQTSVVLKNLDDPVQLTAFIETMEDVDQQYTVEQVQSEGFEHLWKRNISHAFIGSNVNSKYWFRLTINWQGQEQEAGSYCS